MRIWMEDHYGEKGHFAVKITLYLLLLLAVAMVLPVGVTLLALRRGWPVTEIALAVCLADVILTVYGAGEIGNKVHRYCTVFCRDNSGRLFGRHYEIRGMQQRACGVYPHALQYAEDYEKYEGGLCSGALHV